VLERADCAADIPKRVRRALPPLRALHLQIISPPLSVPDPAGRGKEYYREWGVESGYLFEYWLPESGKDGYWIEVFSMP